MDIQTCIIIDANTQMIVSKSHAHVASHSASADGLHTCNCYKENWVCYKVAVVT